MAQVKIYGLKSSISKKRTAISEAIHKSLVEVIQLPAGKKFQRFIALEDGDFIFPEDRGRDYTIIEIVMFAGRSSETKKNLIAEIFSNMKNVAGIDPQNVEITIIESEKTNWGIRGKNGADLQLDYKVEI